MMLRGRELSALYPPVSSPDHQSLFHKKRFCRARRTPGSRRMLGEDIGREQRRSAKSYDFNRELLLGSYVRRHRLSALAA
jgi:hypothetical protein